MDVIFSYTVRSQAPNALFLWAQNNKMRIKRCVFSISNGEYEIKHYYSLRMDAGNMVNHTIKAFLEDSITFMMADDDEVSWVKEIFHQNDDAW